MNWNELKQRIISEYDSRNLKSKVRYDAIGKIENFIKQRHPQAMAEVTKLTAIDKQHLKDQYTQQKGKNINGAESSVINEIYNQLSNL